MVKRSFQKKQEVFPVSLGMKRPGNRSGHHGPATCRKSVGADQQVLGPHTLETALFGATQLHLVIFRCKKTSVMIETKCLVGAASLIPKELSTASYLKMQMEVVAFISAHVAS